MSGDIYFIYVGMKGKKSWLIDILRGFYGDGSVYKRCRFGPIDYYGMKVPIAIDVANILRLLGDK